MVSIVASPFLFFKEKHMLFLGRFLSHYVIWILKIFLNTKTEFKGLDNLKKYEKFFVASAHQSMFETFALQTVINSPIFILKKELLKIPIFGWYLIKIGSISIDRGKTTKENLDFFKKINKSINETNRPLIIFPQGTRLKPDDRSQFKKGVSRIYNELKIKCQPVAINSGTIWPKKENLKPNLTLIISILKPIEAGMNKEIFLEILQKKIYTELDSLN